VIVEHRPIGRFHAPDRQHDMLAHAEAFFDSGERVAMLGQHFVTVLDPRF
jgi:hypothetical protein